MSNEPTGDLHNMHVSDNRDKFVVGVDYGTLSGRALVVRVSDGREMGSAVHSYAHGVMDRALAATGGPLPPDWALQDPQDYIDVLRDAVPKAISASGVAPAQVIGIATDFTACTMVPVLADGTPLCRDDRFRDRPHAYVKLWKHHAAQSHADRINALAADSPRTMVAALRRTHLLGVAVRQRPAVAGRRPRNLCRDRAVDRSGGLDHLAAVRQRDTQRLHGRLQGHLSGRRLAEQ